MSARAPATASHLLALARQAQRSQAPLRELAELHSLLRQAADDPDLDVRAAERLLAGVPALAAEQAWAADMQRGAEAFDNSEAARGYRDVQERLVGAGRELAQACAILLDPRRGAPGLREARDLDDIERLAWRFYGAFDNRGKRVPTLEAIVSLFAPGANIVRDAGDTCESWSVDAFAAPRIRLLTSGELVGFHEWETAGTTRLLGAVAERRSTYEKSGTLDGQPYAGGGEKLFHFGRFAEGWRITAIAWSDRPGAG